MLGALFCAFFNTFLKQLQKPHNNTSKKVQTLDFIKVKYDSTLIYYINKKNNENAYHEKRPDQIFNSKLHNIFRSVICSFDKCLIKKILIKKLRKLNIF